MVPQIHLVGCGTALVKLLDSGCKILQIRPPSLAALSLGWLARILDRSLWWVRGIHFGETELSQQLARVLQRSQAQEGDGTPSTQRSAN